MDARFRIRTREGEEISPTSVEAFSELVRSGAVRDHDMVFDALTGEWAPASLHPMVRLFQDPLVVDPTAEAVERRLAAVQDAPPPAPGSSGEEPVSSGDELVLDLVESEAVSPEEEARAFMAKMEEERRSDPDQPALSLEVPLLETRPLTKAAQAEPEAEAEIEAEAAVETNRVSARASLGAADPPRSGPERSFADQSRRRGWVNAAILTGGALALALSVVWAPGGGEHDADAGVARAQPTSASTRAVPVTEEETRGRALDSFLDGVEALRAELGVGLVPREWLEGRYLADAEAYPEVRSYWERYLAFVEAARAAEVTLYRGAYLGAATEAGLSGPVRSLRLAAAQGDFASRRARREVVYGQVEALARAALALDDLVVELKGRVTFEPIAGPRVSADPVIEAAGTDEEAQLRLEGALDRVLQALHEAEGKPTAGRDGVPGLLVGGLRRAEKGG